MKLIKTNNGLDFFKQFDDMFDGPFFKTTKAFLRTDVVEEDDKFILDIDIPGFTKENIKISFENGYLSVEAQKSDENHVYICRERYSGTVNRRYYLGEVDDNGIKASYENGILTIIVPKQKPEATIKTINIE